MSKHESRIEMEPNRDEPGFEIKTSSCEGGFMIVCYIISSLGLVAIATFFVLKAVQDYTDLL